MSWKDLFTVLPIKVSGKEDNKIQNKLTTKVERNGASRLDLS